jgi:hypothetical protein
VHVLHQPDALILPKALAQLRPAEQFVLMRHTENATMAGDPGTNRDLANQGIVLRAPRRPPGCLEFLQGMPRSCQSEAFGWPCPAAPAGHGTRLDASRTGRAAPPNCGRDRMSEDACDARVAFDSVAVSLNPDPTAEEDPARPPRRVGRLACEGAPPGYRKQTRPPGAVGQDHERCWVTLEAVPPGLPRPWSRA